MKYLQGIWSYKTGMFSGHFFLVSLFTFPLMASCTRMNTIILVSADSARIYTGPPNVPNVVSPLERWAVLYKAQDVIQRFAVCHTFQTSRPNYDSLQETASAVII